MPYQAELSDGPREVRKQFANNVLRFWPKIPGVGNVAVDPSPAPTFATFKPDSTGIATAQMASVVAVDGVSALDLTIDTSSLDTFPIGEHYRVDVTWFYQGALQLEQIRFDVATAPYYPSLSLNDLVEEVADCEQTLAGQAKAIRDGRTAEQHASVLGVKAWAHVYQWLEARLADQDRIAPRLIVDRWRITPVVRAMAMFCLFKAEGSSSRSKELAEEWHEEAKRRFSALGNLDYDTNDDGVADAPLQSPVEWSVTRRWSR